MAFKAKGRVRDFPVAGVPAQDCLRACELMHHKYHRFPCLRNIVFAALCFLLLAGCAAKRDRYNVPALQLPERYAKAPMAAGAANPENATVTLPAPSLPLSAALAEWWRLLGSPELDGLMDRALANNPDLRVAALRIAQSKTRLDQAGADKVPVITMPVQVNTQYPEFGAGRGNANGSNISRTTNQISLRGDWRPDIWGEASSLYESAGLQLWRVIFQRDDVQRNVVANVSVSYIEYLSLNDRLKVARETEKALSEMLASVDARLEVGDATITELEQQKAAAYSARATIPVLEQQREVVLNRLASLVGAVPVALELSDSGLNSVNFPSVLPGVPSALLLRRPDVRAVEARLLAADADIDVARTRVLPPLDLTAQVGYGSSYMSRLFLPQALFWNTIANLSVTIFDSGKRSNEVEFAQAVHEEMVETYVRVIYDAVREVDDSLSAIRFMGKRLEAQGIAADSALRAWNFSQESYMAGAVDYLVVLDTERTYHRNLDDWYNVRMDQYRGLVSLFSALGGGVAKGDALPGGGVRPSPLPPETDGGVALRAAAGIGGGVALQVMGSSMEINKVQSQPGSLASGFDATANITDAPLPEQGDKDARPLNDPVGLALSATLRSKVRDEGVDWSENQLRADGGHWLVELSGMYDRSAVLPAWRDLRARFSAQTESLSLLPHRQGRVDEAGKESASWYRLFIAKFPDKKMAEELCATLRAGQQRCGIVSSHSLAGKDGFHASSASQVTATDQGRAGKGEDGRQP